MKKIILAWLLVVCLCVSLMPVAVAAEAGLLDNFQQVTTYTEGQFTDVPSTEWYASSVVQAYELGLISGSSETTFSPEGQITGGETLALACRLHNTYTNGSATFENGSPWYQPYVDYAMDNGIISEELSSYTTALSRAEFTEILCGALSSEAFPVINTVADNQIPDVTITDACADSIYSFYRAGILAGNDEYGTFTPDEPITRSAVAVILVRIVDEAARMDVALQDKPILPEQIYTTASLSMYTGDTKELSVSFVPVNTTVKSVTWASSNPSVATVTSNGVVTAVAAGTTQITITTSNGVSTGCNVTVTKTPSIGAVNAESQIGGFSYYKNSADGITLYWQAPNNSGKTINYYTVHCAFYNAVGDPAYDEITHIATKDVKYVGPVAPNADLLVYGIIGYVPVCHKIVVEYVDLVYADDTTERVWLYHTTTSSRLYH